MIVLNRLILFLTFSILIIKTLSTESVKWVGPHNNLHGTSCSLTDTDMQCIETEMIDGVRVLKLARLKTNLGNCVLNSFQYMIDYMTAKWGKLAMANITGVVMYTNCVPGESCLVLKAFPDIETYNSVWPTNWEYGISLLYINGRLHERSTIREIEPAYDSIRSCFNKMTKILEIQKMILPSRLDPIYSITSSNDTKVQIGFKTSVNQKTMRDWSTTIQESLTVEVSISGEAEFVMGSVSFGVDVSYSNTMTGTWG
jgi:hypothetical protein